MSEFMTEKSTSILIRGKEVFPVQVIGRGKFPVILFTCQEGLSKYAVKLFPFQHHLYLNEERFLLLDHENISSPIQILEEFTPRENSKKKFSISVQEFLPNLDFFTVLFDLRIKFEENLVRTYFHQLIDGLEYLHTKDIAHLDLKLENIMFDKSFKLKIIDFDLAFKRGDVAPKSMGTVCYRAPEILQKKCRNPQASDIYSAGILLFILKSGRNYPHCEHIRVNGADLQKLLDERPEEFWVKHTLYQGEGQNFWSQEFRELFCGMTLTDPVKRFAIADIKSSSWYNGEVLTDEMVFQLMSSKVTVSRSLSVTD